MRVRGVFYAEMLEGEGGTGTTQYIITFTALFEYRASNFKRAYLGVQDASEAHPGTVGKLRVRAFQRCPDELLRRLARRDMPV